MPKLNYQRGDGLSNPYATPALVCGWLSVISIITLVGSVLGLIVIAQRTWISNGLTPTQIMLTIVAIASGLTILSAPWIYWSCSSDAARIDRFRQGFSAGNFLVRWRYETAPWEIFHRHVKRTRFWLRADWIAIAFLAALAPAIVIAVGFAPDATPNSRRIGWMILLAVWAALAGMQALCSIARARRLRRLAEGNIAILSTVGAYANGGWILWGTATRVLREVKVMPADGEKQMRIQFHIHYGNNTRMEEVLVPEGQFDLACKVAATIMQNPNAQEGGAMNTAGNVMQGLVWILRMFR